jgi:hypothetical protein
MLGLFQEILRNSCYSTSLHIAKNGTLLAFACAFTSMELALVLTTTAAVPTITGRRHKLHMLERQR